MTPQTAIMNAVDDLFDRQLEFLEQAVSHPSTRGKEESMQRFVAEELSDRGYAVDLWHLDAADLASLPGYSPRLEPYENAMNVVAKATEGTGGRSLILNAHVDVVPPGPAEMWSNPPFEPVRANGWLYGRGAGDMKAGLSANIFALDALRSLGLKPAGACQIQSVVEEECTGNGALATLQRGYGADAVLIPEPFDETLVTAQIGVIWLRVRLKGIPAHVAAAGTGFNAIEAAIPIIAALRALEKEWNDPALRHVAFDQVDHPLNLNIGVISGGDWPSSVPAHVSFDFRMAIYPGQDLEQAKRALETCIFDAAGHSVHLRNSMPEIVYHGFLAEGYVLDTEGEAAREATEILRRAHQAVNGRPLVSGPITATTDARFYGLYAKTPSLVYGPRAQRIHGFDECVELESLRRVTQSIALFVADWCGLQSA